MNKFYIGLLGALFFVSFFTIAAPAQASSLTSVQVSAIISLLQSFGVDSATISNVSLILISETPNPRQSCFYFSPNLTLGSTGSQVSELQSLLYIYPATGYFGPITERAVQNWQSAHNIPVTENVGSQMSVALACSGASQ